MQYFGYLRRNPNDPPEPGLNFDGYNFWLNNLNQFNGNFVNAEMVKAFITSGEYRQRFQSLPGRSPRVSNGPVRLSTPSEPSLMVGLPLGYLLFAILDLGLPKSVNN
jgi:hypothetical protein